MRATIPIVRAENPGRMSIDLDGDDGGQREDEEVVGDSEDEVGVHDLLHAPPAGV